MLQKFAGKTVFAINLNILEFLSKSIIEDYKLNSNTSNYEYLFSLLSKKQFKRMKSDIKKAFQCLNTMLVVEQIPKSCDMWVKKFNFWQRFLTKLHITTYYENVDKLLCWKYLGTTLHYLFDCLHHIFAKLSEVEGSCMWCGLNLELTWNTFLSEIFMKRMPEMYLFFSLGQSYFLSKKIDYLVIDKAINDYGLLVKTFMELRTSEIR